MQPHYLPKHLIFKEKNLGSEQWWHAVQTIGTPLLIENNQHIHCTFLWRNTNPTDAVYIDIYSQSKSIYQQWQVFQQIEHTDIAFFEIEVPLHWSGSYVLVATSAKAPQSLDRSIRRQWWQTQLQQHAQIDPLNPYSAYPGQISRWVNRLYLGSLLPLDTGNSLPAFHSIEWQHQRLGTTYPVDLFSTAKQNSADPLIIFLDGQVWSRHLSILQHVQMLTDSGQIAPANYAFLHSVTSAQRCLDYGCRDLFSQALVEDLLPLLYRHFALASSTAVVLCGQSLGGLCALHTSLLYPDVFQSLILQSGSYWWCDYRHSNLFKGQTQRFLDLVPQHLAQSQKRTRLLISAGQCESDMREDSLQLYRELNAQQSVQYQIFAGGHDAVNWQHDLVTGLRNLLS